MSRKHGISPLSDLSLSARSGEREGTRRDSDGEGEVSLRGNIAPAIDTHLAQPFPPQASCRNGFRASVSVLRFGRLMAVSLRAQRSNLGQAVRSLAARACFVAALLAMTADFFRCRELQVVGTDALPASAAP